MSMDIDLIFKIAAIGIIVSILNQVLSRSGREEQATMTSLAGLVVVLMMLAQKIRQCEDAGDDFETTKEKVLDYHNHLHTLFCLESMNNLARNGRVNIAVAKIAGMLGIRVAGEAKGGQVAPVHKPRGLRKTTQMLVDMVKERGFRDGGYIRVAHCFAEEAAADFREALLAEFPNARFMLEPTTALCSYYAEVGGLIIGFVTRCMDRLEVNPFFSTIAASFLMALPAYVAAGLGWLDCVAVVIIGALMLLVPGLLITNSMRDIIYGDTNSGVNRIVQVLLSALAIASKGRCMQKYLQELNIL